jgi:CBS domain containing-hemolysin-like protein
MRTEALTWIGIAFCIAQSAFFAGLNLAIFSVSRLRLEVEAAGGNANAVRLLELRRDSNLTWQPSYGGTWARMCFSRFYQVRC